MKPLLGILSPRDIDELHSLWWKLDIDKLIIKYLPEKLAYPTLRNFFLDSPEYTHLIFCADDCELKQEYLNMLYENANKYPILCGVCNVEVGMPMVNVSYTLPNRIRPYITKYITYDDVISGINRVLYAGFPLMCLRRDIVEDIPFRTDESGGWVDIMFNLDCYDSDYSIMCDKRIKFFHKRNHDPLLVGKKSPKVIYERREST